MKPTVKIFNNPEAVAHACAEYLMELINAKNTHIALSGGSTPNLLFKILGQDYSFKIKWPNAHLYWGDERCVPPFSSESNFKTVKSSLIDHVAIPAENVHRIRGENDPIQETMRYTQRIKTLVPTKNGLPAFDVVMLGLGSDGHTASIFPDQLELIQSREICELAVHPDSGQQRVTLTGSVINNATMVMFIVTGESKAEKVAEILGGRKNSENYPAAHIKNSNGELIWFLDEAASAKLSK